MKTQQENVRLNFEQFKMNKANEIVLGEGLTSIVKRTEIDGKAYAIKTFKQNVSGSSIKKEIAILSILKHHNIIELYDSDAMNRWLITELLHPKDLFDFLAINGRAFKIEAIKYITLQLAGAIQFLHKSNVVHRDIKLENILVDDQLTLKLCDFGFAEYSDAGLVPRTTGTLGYLAPELQISGQVNASELKSADVFSLGVCLFTLAYGHPPFRKSDRSCAFWRTIASGNWGKFWNAVDKGNQKEKSFYMMIQGMLDPRPAQRWSVDQILECEFLVGHSKEQYFCEIMERMKLFGDG